MKKISFLFVVIIFALGVNAQELRDFVGEYSIVETIEKNIYKSTSHRDTIGIRLSDLKQIEKDTSNVKVVKSQGFGIRYNDLIDKVPAKKNAKIILEENKLVLTQNNEKKEYIFKNINKEKDHFVIESIKGENIVINKAEGVLHIQINDELFVLKK